jgi:tellurite resistance protein TerC
MVPAHRSAHEPDDAEMGSVGVQPLDAGGHERMMDATFAAWAALLGGLVALLLLDLFVLHRGAHEISMRDAGWSTAGFIAISVVFGVVLGLIEGSTVAGEFFAGYLLEKSLSLDNVFVWALIFSAFSIPSAYQHRVLFYGIFGALVMRGAFVAAGAELLERFDWVIYVFGALLLYSGVRMLRGSHDIDPERDPLVRLLRRRLPTTRGLRGAHLFVPARDVPISERPERQPIRGVWYATPMLAVLSIIEFTDHRRPDRKAQRIPLCERPGKSRAPRTAQRR